MPVTELVFFTTTAHGTITPEFKATCADALKVQDEWCTANLPGAPRGHEARGAALFQQTEDPAVTLLTAHWESVSEHEAWIASEENRRVFSAVQEHIDRDRMRYFHIDGVEAFSATEDAGLTPVLQSPVVSVARCFVEKDKKAEFDRVYGGVRSIHDDFAKPYVQRGGWRIEKEEGREDVEQYVMIGGWDSVEAVKEFPKHKDFSTYADAMKTVMLDCDVKYYRRIL
ncbi:hypothetical protein DL770_005189 [Monosporascus sp. CRB-9-2]|nr:hypothetical protein DL770_005189 [Monosporascus sp. CRB-9-2]